jgi:hypothetical protein
VPEENAKGLLDPEKVAEARAYIDDYIAEIDNYAVLERRGQKLTLVVGSAKKGSGKKTQDNKRQKKQTDAAGGPADWDRLRKVYTLDLTSLPFNELLADHMTKVFATSCDIWRRNGLCVAFCDFLTFYVALCCIFFIVGQEWWIQFQWQGTMSTCSAP